MFWVVPILSVVVAIGLAVGLVVLDHTVGRVHDVFLYPGPPDGARTLLSSIVTAMITFTGMVFSVSIVVLQLTNGQFSSRVVRIYLRDLTVQATLGIFLATFSYSMVVQRAVRGNAGDGAFVPRIAVTAALALVVASVVMFIWYISHISNMVRVATIVSVIAGESRDLLEERYPAGTQERGESRTVRKVAPTLPPLVGTIVARRAGVLVSLNEERLVDLAREADRVVVVLSRVGDFVPLDAPICQLRSARSDDVTEREKDRISKTISLDTERTMVQDLGFGFRQLVDIAERALSPAMNDPTTACQCLDVMHDLLRRLSCRQLPDGILRDDDGKARVVVPQYDFADYLEVSLAEIWRYGSDSPQIPHRVSSMLADLAGVTRGQNREAVRKWQHVVDGSLPAGVAVPASDPLRRVSSA